MAAAIPLPLPPSVGRWCDAQLLVQLRCYPTTAAGDGPQGRVLPFLQLLLLSRRRRGPSQCTVIYVRLDEGVVKGGSLRDAETGSDSLDLLDTEINVSFHFLELLIPFQLMVDFNSQVVFLFTQLNMIIHVVLAAAGSETSGNGGIDYRPLLVGLVPFVLVGVLGLARGLLHRQEVRSLCNVDTPQATAHSG
ncbi:uncharacterized protein LOC129583014 isoform X1 [Paramacrobiotus metropolitanus]|uniref:uncharacterized protein LOC129583014 isoform X1 n=1 Tax=Paramacrobiotus metropolitanus TaxID=2943436 RepID=UPI002445F16A|nr:uncharacterized protein LOC129583014 isoform X1 [Paramacrobiotus metropolitanus]XP_055330661.1 uncharacterized protein LOC129583014 isoform X1 [Paramacrobiotus metropolitanus]XP_055330662.1 uncharacterized protein LOC129583014 isoform X1 [Paramacrobiotus metropolitanus]XP_055330663.1 uncharacterized protein LOC129583014 isoform X1 [Paramacrobiotus metropolitanus]XP_055330664.1 uncharacterized protein LOC129583014 isoform X1 [Paramacrobiotus metropolitanus]XP_055330665.1 uncharacterized prot